jgi:hypothetical protein
VFLAVSVSNPLLHCADSLTHNLMVQTVTGWGRRSSYSNCQVRESHCGAVGHGVQFSFCVCVIVEVDFVCW